MIDQSLIQGISNLDNKSLRVLMETFKIFEMLERNEGKLLSLVLTEWGASSPSPSFADY